MKYLGNKERLINFIFESLSKEGLNINNIEAVDLFSGTGSVTRHLLLNDANVLSVDNMNYSAATQYYKLYFREEPYFHELENVYNINDLQGVLNYLNNLKPKKGYCYNNFCKDGEYKRNYFTTLNAMKIDAIRDEIENFRKHLTYEKYMYLVGCLMEAADYVSNVAGTYGAYLKIQRKTALNIIYLVKSNPIICGNVNILVENVNHIDIKGKDLVYLDPPYNTRQYASNFHLLESLVVWDKQNLKGKTGLRDYSKQKSLFSSKSKVESAFRELINNIKNNKFIAISYSTEGIVSIDFLISLLNKYGEVFAYDRNYRRFKTNAWTNNNTNLKEVLIICKVRKD